MMAKEKRRMVMEEKRKRRVRNKDPRHQEPDVSP